MVCDLNSEECCCPFAFTEASEVVQNYGCLPTGFEIIHMRVAHGKTWACHSQSNVPCVGAIRALAANGLPHHVIDNKLVTEMDDWSVYAGTNEERSELLKNVTLLVRSVDNDS